MKNITELFPVGRGSRKGDGILSPDGVRVFAGNAGNGRKCLGIAIGANVMKSMRWVTADRVTLDVDEWQSTVTIRRVLPSAGVMSWKLSGRNGGKCNPGEAIASTVKINAEWPMLNAFGLTKESQAYIPQLLAANETGVTFLLKHKWKRQGA